MLCVLLQVGFTKVLFELQILLVHKSWSTSQVKLAFLYFFHVKLLW
jgi:hypothetical protein